MLGKWVRTGFCGGRRPRRERSRGTVVQPKDRVKSSATRSRKENKKEKRGLRVGLNEMGWCDGGRYTLERDVSHSPEPEVEEEEEEGSGV